MARTVSETFGRDVADELAALAIDMLVGAPERQKLGTSTAYVPWAQIHRGRAVLDAAGIDWLAIKRDMKAGRA